MHSSATAFVESFSEIVHLLSLSLSKCVQKALQCDGMGHDNHT